MALLAVDLGGTKLAVAILSEEGKILQKKVTVLDNLRGDEVGRLITDNIISMVIAGESAGLKTESVGISVPGISHFTTGTVWAPNIAEWEEYPLLAEVRKVFDLPVTIDSDRACYILGELWKGNAKGCRDAIFLSVGTGIGAGILINGEILRGSSDIAGCIGWMALQKPFENEFKNCGCFEYYASGEGITRLARTLLTQVNDYSGELKNKNIDTIKTSDIFSAYDNGDPLAARIIGLCIEYWGMAVANLVSLFNPEKIIFGGGVFGPAKKFLPAIRDETVKWAQPVSILQVSLDVSALEGDAGLYGAAYLALKKLSDPK
jgi:glucokinase